MKENQAVSGSNPRDMTYEEWLAKFDDSNKPKTSDDTFTPKKVYEAVRDYAVNKYGLEGRRIVRPFYPGGDFEKFNYQEGDVVIDNPPFSILRKIKIFYVKNKIDFFLFAPGLAMFTKIDEELGIKYIITGENITFENGAKVNTGFVTNLGKNKVETAPELGELIRELQDGKEAKPTRIYPPEVITSARLSTLAQKGQKVVITGETKHTRNLKHMEELGIKSFFGGGLLLKPEDTKKIEEAEKKTTEKNVIKIELSDEERAWCNS